MVKLEGFPVWTCPRHGDYQESFAPRHWHQQDNRSICQECYKVGEAQEKDYDRLQRINATWWRSGVPPKFRNRRFSNYRAIDSQSKQALEAARSVAAADITALALIGAVGRGKSHLSVAIVAEVIRRGGSALWIYTPDLLRNLRASYAKNADTSTDEILSKLESVQLLVLDEVGASARSEWETNTLSVLIDERYRNDAGLVLTGNVPDLAGSVGVRGADRIAEMGCVIAMLGQSYRSKAPDDAGLLVPDDFTEPTKPTIVLNVKGVDQIAEMPI